MSDQTNPRENGIKIEKCDGLECIENIPSHIIDHAPGSGEILNSSENYSTSCLEFYRIQPEVEGICFTMNFSSNACEYKTISRSDLSADSLRRKWSANDFITNQIWAVYGGLDSMPRVYVRINNVISPNEVSVSMLEPNPRHNSEIYWVEENLPFSCGLFRASTIINKIEMSKFAYPVRCGENEKRSFYRIYPRKGEIWAVYKNWHNQWKHSDFERYHCRIVQILSDFSDESGIKVLSLVEVKDCTTFFQRQLYDGFELIKTISRMEMLCFSHRIMAFLVPGVDKYDIPLESWHMEPDTLPPPFSTKSIDSSIYGKHMSSV